MKRILLALLLFGVANAASAQELGIGLKPVLGMYNPSLPMVSIDNGINPSIELYPSTAVGVELDLWFSETLGAYAGTSAAFTQLQHTELFELEGPNPITSETTVLMTALGVLWTPITIPVRPVARVGLGSKWYDFTFPEMGSDNAMDIMLDLGVGITAQTGPLSFVTEVRWVPSLFDPTNLPIRLPTDPGLQLQSDWLFQIGFRYGPPDQE